MLEIISPEHSLLSFVQEADDKFENAYGKMISLHKEKLRDFLIYLSKVLNGYTVSTDKFKVNFTHLHLPFMDDEAKDAILEFLVLSEYYEGETADDQEDLYVSELIAQHKRKLQNNTAPADTSATNKKYRDWAKDRKVAAEKLKFLATIEGKSLLPRTVINVLISDADRLADTFATEWYTTTLEKLRDENRRSYVLLNTELPKDKFANLANDINILKGIKRIILFDSSSRQAFKGFNKRELDELKEYEIPINDLLILTFEGEDFRLKNTKSRLQKLYANFYRLPQGDVYDRTYFFHPSEFKLLAAEDNSSSTSLEWFGSESETCHDYLDMVKDLGLDKLRSIPILNLLSFCFNDKVASIIRDELLGKGMMNNVLDADTKEQINELAAEERNALAAVMNATLSIVVSEWKTIRERIFAIAGHKTAIVVPHQVIKDQKINKELTTFCKGIRCNLYSWNDLKEQQIKETTIIILAYRDTGRPPFDIYPNMIELKLPGNKSVHSLALEMFFKNRFNHSGYSYLNAYNKLSNNEFRTAQHLNGKIGESFQQLNGRGYEYALDADDLAYGIGATYESVKIDFDDMSHASYYPSKLMICKRGEQGKYTVIRADDLEDMYFEDHYVQPLEDIFEHLNLFEITPDEEKELLQIKERYQLVGKESEFALWKVLLKEHLVEYGNDPALLYEKIKDVTGNDGKLIQFSYFCDNWLKVDSELLMPRLTRHFRQLCDFLGLPRAYYRLKLKKRASTRSNSRKSNDQMNKLLEDIIEKGLFEDGVEPEQVDIQQFAEQHALEEKGILQELPALITLLKDEINLKKVLKTQRS